MHNPAKIGRLARERFSCALMSDAKWRKLIMTIGASGLPIHEVAVKFIDVEAPRRMHFPPSLTTPHAYMDTIEWGPVELRAIEWLEFSTDLEGLLSAIGHFPLEQEGGVTRIVGYRP